MAVRAYQGLHQRIGDVLPDDFYITETLTLAIKPDTDDRRALIQVQLVASQMVTYLDGLLRDQQSGGFSWSWSGAGAPPDAPHPPNPPMPPNPPDWRSLGREIQDQIINLTRNTLRRAMSSVDFEFAGPVHGADMRGEDLTRRRFHAMRIHGANLQGAHAEAVDFSEAHLAGCNLNAMNLTRANLTDARLEGCQLHEVNLTAANCERTVFIGCDFTRANLRDANLNGARFVNPTFTDAVMPDGSAFRGDLRAFGAVVVSRRIHIDISTDDDDEPKPKRTPDDVV